MVPRCLALQKNQTATHIFVSSSFALRRTGSPVSVVPHQKRCRNFKQNGGAAHLCNIRAPSKTTAVPLASVFLYSRISIPIVDMLLPALFPHPTRRVRGFGFSDGFIPMEGEQRSKCWSEQQPDTQSVARSVHLLQPPTRTFGQLHMP